MDNTIIDTIKSFGANVIPASACDRPGTCPGPLTLFEEEINNKPKQYLNFAKSWAGLTETTYHGRKCYVKMINRSDADCFIDQFHIQGKNKLGLVAFGLFHNGEMVAVLSLGRHHRNVSNLIVLDRLCFASGIRVVGGSGKLVNIALQWAQEHKYEKIITFSDNRLSDGKVYLATGFISDVVYRPDYFYTSNGKIVSKQSQKKSSSKCPDGLTEREWAEARGMIRFWDAGKTRWTLATGVPPDLFRTELSRRCAEQHKSGLFKHSHIRGLFKSKKNNDEIYFSSSYELRCLYDLENDPEVISFRRADSFLAGTKWRNPDILSVKSGKNTLIEVKPKALLDSKEVQEQLFDSEKYASENNMEFEIWTEDNSGIGGEKEIIKWAKSYITEMTGDTTWTDRQKNNSRKSSKKHYQKIKQKKIKIHCEFCNIDHELMEISYNQNIKKNGRYVCIRENGSKTGSKTKYVPRSEQTCCYCKELKPISEFTIDKSRKNGHSSKCKICSRIKNRERYHKQ